MVGSLVGGLLANKYGRRWANAIGCMICIFGVLGSTFSPVLWLFLIFRVFLGGGIGITAVVCPMYVSEMAPPEKRGSLGVLFQLTVTLGILFSFAIGYGIKQIETLTDFYKWRIMLGMSVLLPIALLVLTLLKMVEPSSWTGDVDQMDYREKPSLIEILKNKQLRILLITDTVLACILQLTGINAVMYYGPDIISKAGVQNADLLNIGVGAWNCFATFIAIFLVDRVGRRPLMLGGVALLSLSLIGIGVVFLVTEKIGQVGTGIGVGVGLAFFLLGFEVGPGCLFWVVINELFPEQYIEFGGTYANILQWGFNLLVSTTFPLLGAPDVLDSSGVFFLFGGIGVVCFIYSFIFLKETKKESYEAN
eukprot:TRINITY_DN15942_c0_g1_i1.p1 TRINITY_DN15942_c0_g1~~TRINITY_DN15942_c0_g1_i1.p1  ORF type:complete len:426 (+),score=91.23 TRINITY_DN15942_c0_g1_i1:187-1278(+)